MESAAELIEFTGLLKRDWRHLSAADRDRRLTELIGRASALRNGLNGSADGAQGPTEDDVRAQLRAASTYIDVQPIVRLQTREVIGFEALTRFAQWPPDCWFRKAWEMGVGLEFELLAVERALPTLVELPPDLYLSINVSPLTLISDELSVLLSERNADRIVLELTEHEPIADYDVYQERIRTLRGRGTRIAIDDVGAGHSSLLHIIKLAPDIIKLDRGLIAECDGDPVLDVLMRCIAQFARETDSSVVAEGIETAAEAATLISAGIAFGQGSYFGRPARHPAL